MEESLYKSLVEAFVVVGVSCLNDMRPLPPIEGNFLKTLNKTLEIQHSITIFSTFNRLTLNFLKGHAVAYEPHLLDCIPESRREDSIIRDISLVSIHSLTVFLLKFIFFLVLFTRGSNYF